MPNKTIYVADADLPIFDRAQQLAGDNLSATIVQALRRFVAAHDARGAMLSEVSVKIGDAGTYFTRRFLGRELARRRVREQDLTRITTQIVYQTAKGRLALHTAVTPDWSGWSRYWSSGELRRDEAAEDWRRMDWASWGDGQSYRFDVYDTLDALREHVPPELAAAVESALAGEDGAFLDI